MGKCGPKLRVPWSSVAVVAPIAVVLWCTIATQLPPKVYNCFDDLQKYFAYPVRMLETGTLFGSPLSGIGSETLGGEAFLHGFVLTTLPFSYLNGMDAVFGLFLCLALAAQFATKRSDQLGAALVCLVAVVFINPQYVNISALYLGSALIMAAILLSATPLEMDENGDGPAPNPAAMGLLYAAMVSLKTTFFLFAALHLPAVAVGVALAGRSFRASLRWAVLTTLYFWAFLCPWVLLHAPHYLAALGGAPAGVADLAGAHATESLTFLSTHRLPYGGSMALYSGLVAAVLGGSLLAFWAGAKTPDRRLRLSARTVGAAGLSGAAAYVIMLSLVGPRLGGIALAVRYFTPIAIGIAPAVFGLTASHLARSEREMPRMVRLGLPLVLAGIPLACFWPSLCERATQAMKTGSVLAFSALARQQGYAYVNERLMDPSERDAVARAQARVPAGEELVAWINAPFYLDFRRNPIVDVDPAGLATGWAGFPVARYFIWEYNGLATSPASDYAREAKGVGVHARMIGLSSLAFARRLEIAVRTGSVMYNDGRIIVFQATRAMPGTMTR
jgi:hypothetical protein